MAEFRPEKERAIVVGVAPKAATLHELQESLNELVQLTETAGASVVGLTQQRLHKITPATYIGGGKIEEIKALADEAGADTVIFDIPHLTGTQQRNLETVLKRKVLDRTQVILDIFAQRAQSKEGQLQVELAMLKDKLPRLIGEAIAGLSRLAGGIGTLGPGESKLEIDRRRIKEKITRLKRELDVVRRNRALHRARRQTSRIPSIALVGYTNSGKSTLFNVLTKSQVLAEDILFATLDPTTRKYFLSSQRQVLLTDTVGFIHNLPHDLVEAFKATFEEVEEADVLLHVMDLSHPSLALHSKVSMEQIKKLGLENKPIIHVYNKADLATPLRRSFGDVPKLNPSVAVSSLTGEGLDQLAQLIERTLSQMTKVVDLYLPTESYQLIFRLDRDARILKREEGPTIIHCQVELTDEALQRWSKYLEPPDLR